MHKILVADSSPLIANALAEVFSGICEVHQCSSPADLLPLLESLHPSAVIVYAPFLGISGLLQLSNAAFRPQHLIILTNIITEHLLETAQVIHASYLSLIPFHMRSFEQTLRDLLE